MRSESCARCVPCCRRARRCASVRRAGQRQREETPLPARAGARCCAIPGRTGLRCRTRRRGSAASARRSRSTITGSGSSLTPVRRSNSSPSRKSRLPCRTYTGDAAGGERRRPVAGAHIVGIVVVVADPDFEQVAEQIERVGAARAGPARNVRNASMAQGASLSRCRSEANSVARSLTSAAASAGGESCGGTESRGRRSAAGGVGRRCRLPGAGQVPRRRPAPAHRPAARSSGSPPACSGASCLNGPMAPVGETLMRSTTSMPSTTLAEHGVAPARRQRIEIGVVGDVDEELASPVCGPEARASPTVPRRFLRPLPASFGMGFSVGLAL